MTKPFSLTNLSKNYEFKLLGKLPLTWHKLHSSLSKYVIYSTKFKGYLPISNLCNSLVHLWFLSNPPNTYMQFLYILAVCPLRSIPSISFVFSTFVSALISKNIINAYLFSLLDPSLEIDNI